MNKNGRNKSKQAPGRTSFGDYQFCDIRLTKDDKAAFDKWATEHVSDAFDLLDAIANSGVKSSYSWSDTNDCFTFSLTDNLEGSQNYHVVMVSRADNFQEALMLALYKHYKLCDGELWPVQSQQSDWG